MPLYLGLAIRHFDAGVGDDVSMVGVVARVFAITIVRCRSACTLRARDPARDRLEPRIKKITLVVFVVVVAGASRASSTPSPSTSPSSRSRR